MKPAFLIAAFLAFSPIQAVAQSSDNSLVAAANSGDPAAQFQLAEKLRIGIGVLQDYSAAAKLYAASAAQGNYDSQASLGALLIQGLGVQQDAETGFGLLVSAANSGKAEHYFTLATAYLDGAGTARDPSKAAEYFERAVQQNHIPAMVALGTLYQNGDGVEQDIERAAELYAPAVKAGHPRAQNNLGLIYACGEVVDQDYELAREFFELAAQAGLAEGLKNLAALYQNGFGVEVDEDRANALLRIAAQGDADGNSGAISFLKDPRLPAPDPAQSEYYASTAQFGDPISLFQLANLIVNGAQTSTDYRSAARAYKAAAEKGLPAAMANLGILSFAGKGVLQDYVDGYAWMTLAAAGGITDAIGIRDQFRSSMTVDQINQANALANARLKDLQEN